MPHGETDATVMQFWKTIQKNKEQCSYVELKLNKHKMLDHSPSDFKVTVNLMLGINRDKARSQRHWAQASGFSKCPHFILRYHEALLEVPTATEGLQFACHKYL